MELFVYTESLTPEEARDYQVGFATLGLARSEDEYRGVEAMIKKYGKVEDGGIGKWIILPAKFTEEQEQLITLISQFADDPLMKAGIVKQGVLGTAAGFQKIRDAGRDDIILTCHMPGDDPNVITKLASFVTHSNDFERGYYDILKCKEMGATAFVHMTFERHMSYETLSRRRNVYKEACKDLGLDFYDVNVPDPTTEIGTAGAQQAVFEMMPALVNKYGTDAVYFTTNTALHEPIIQQCMALGAMFVCQDDLSPICGYATALGLDFSNEVGDWDAILKKIEDAVVAGGQGGRMGTWPTSFTYAASIALTELCIDIIEGRATGSMTDVEKAYAPVNVKGSWSNYLDAATNTPINNYYLVSMDSYLFGKGFTGVLSNPFPEKYFDVK
jgi:hypothetical protein